MVMFSKEKRGGNVVRDPMRERMEDLISDWDLVDVKPAKGKYTWNTKRSGLGHIVARLDRFLVHGDFFLRDGLVS
jgi:hypothetical protein